MNESELTRRVFIQKAYELSKAFALSFALRGLQIGSAASLFIPDQNINDHPAFRRKLRLGHAEKERKRIVGFGDSNMGDWYDENWPRLLNVLRGKVSERGIGGWETHTSSWNGATTSGVLQQIEANRDFLNKAHGKFDAWINVGGNDVAGSLLTDKTIAGEMSGLFENPYSAQTFQILDQFSRNIAQFGESFRTVLDQLVLTYPERLQNVVVITMPNFANCEALRVEEPRIPLQEWSIQSIALNMAIRNAAIGINRQLLLEVDRFSRIYPNYPIIAVNTWGAKRSSFLSDIHYSPEGHGRIADNVLSRLEVR